MSSLLSPVQVGDLQLKNRVIMAALTRTRAGTSHLANDLMAEYYAQRASGGLIFTEASMVDATASAFIGEGGIYSPEHAASWRKVTDAVHAKGGLIAIQLWHPGRATHQDINGGVQPVSSTGRAINASTHTPTGKHPYPVPRVLRTDEIPGVIETFRLAAVHARAAGFDGVQLHGAHGYLLDQFLRDGANDRTDAYGGPLQNRARLLFEVIDAVVGVWGAGRVGVRISPLVPFNDMVDSNPQELVAYVTEQAQARKLGHFELRHDHHDRPEERELGKIARRTFRGALLLNGGFDGPSGEAAVAEGRGDAIVYGKHYLANPDLPERIAKKTELNAFDTRTFYSAGPEGYTDYPRIAA
ncbi:MAG: alkene reductase [Panacagrimonas sp.]